MKTHLFCNFENVCPFINRAEFPESEDITAGDIDEVKDEVGVLILLCFSFRTAHVAQMDPTDGEINPCGGGEHDRMDFGGYRGRFS